MYSHKDISGYTEYEIKVPRCALNKNSFLLCGVCVFIFVGLCVRERQVVWVCVSTCYITESGGTVCFLACHTTADLQWEGERPQLSSASTSSTAFG